MCGDCGREGNHGSIAFNNGFMTTCLVWTFWLLAAVGIGSLGLR